jgi:hypothetical protein
VVPTYGLLILLYVFNIPYSRILADFGWAFITILFMSTHTMMATALVRHMKLKPDRGDSAKE